MIVFFADFFSDECNDDGVEECSEFRADVPLSEEFDPEIFQQYCG